MIRDPETNHLILFQQGRQYRLQLQTPKWAEKALGMDGFENVPVDSDKGRKLLCRRERAWIALFVLERGICLARGRNFSVPVTPLIKHCDGWLRNSMAQIADAAMCAGGYPNLPDGAV